MSIAETVARAAFAALAACLLHDSAHWAMARAVGFRSVRLTIGPFVVSISRRGINVGTARHWREFRSEFIAEPGGDRRAIARWALVTASGPAASLLLAALTWHAVPMLAIASGVRALISLAPVGTSGASPTDGAQLILLLAGGAPADRLTALHRIAAAERSGQRPRTWAEQWTTEATAIRDGTTAEALGCVAAFRRALDGCAHDRAAAYLDRALALRAQLPPRPACALLADAAYFEARIHDDGLRAQLWLTEAAARGSLCPVAERRAAAAVALASGDAVTGAAAAREAMARLERVEREEHRVLPMEADWLREMLARAECAVVLPVDLFATPG